MDATSQVTGGIAWPASSDDSKTAMLSLRIFIAIIILVGRTPAFLAGK
jgi:hypothetical protein